VSEVFVSYRKADRRLERDRLYQAMAQTFGDQRIFKAAEAIEPGTDFGETLVRQAAECKIMLVLIGPAWSDASDEHGQRLLYRAEDWVRREIGTALQAGNRVLPVLLGEQTMLPRAEDLPPDIAQLARLQFFRLPDTGFEAALGQLVTWLESVLPPTPPTSAAADHGSADRQREAGQSVTRGSGTGHMAVASGKYGNAVVAERGANVKIVQRVRRWAIAHPALAITTAVVLLGGGSAATYASLASAATSTSLAGTATSGGLLSDGDKEVCKAASRRSYIDVNALAGLATNTAIKQQLQRISVTASDTTASQDAVDQISKVCDAEGWQAQTAGGGGSAAEQLSPQLPSQTITGVTDTFSCQLLPSISQVLPTIGSLTNESGQKYVFTTAVRGEVSTEGFVVDTGQQLNDHVGRFQLSPFPFKNGDPCYLIAIPFVPGAFPSEGTAMIGVGEMKGAVIIDKATVTTVTG
jgi:hypothetical protein